jgi:hypothetical protein
MFRKVIPAIALATLALGTASALATAPAQADVIYGSPAQAVIYGAPANVFVAAPAFEIAQADPTYIVPGHIRGFVRSFDRFNMTLGIHGRGVPVLLHQGTIIYPTGLTLSPRMLVRVDGFFHGGVFNADRIVLVR